MRGMPPLQGRRQRRLLQADPQTRVREPPPGLPPMRPLCPLYPPGPAQRRHIRPGAEWIPGWIPDGLNPNEPQLLCRTRKKKSRCGPSTNDIPSGPERRKNPDVGQAPIPEESSSVFLLAASFRCSTLGFLSVSPSKIVSTPYIYRDELPISITHFLALDLRFFVFVAR